MSYIQISIPLLAHQLLRVKKRHSPFSIYNSKPFTSARNSITARLTNENTAAGKVNTKIGNKLINLNMYRYTDTYSIFHRSLRNSWIKYWMVCQMDVDYRFEKSHLEHLFRDIMVQ
jgi:hypothetical protein